jgi:hypothetical protein
VSSLIFGAAAADEGDTLHLGSFVISDDQAAAGGMTFRRTFDGAFDVKEAMATTRLMDSGSLNKSARDGTPTSTPAMAGRNSTFDSSNSSRRTAYDTEAPVTRDLPPIP